MSTPQKAFFVGYLKPPKQLIYFLIVCSAGLIIGFSAASFLTGSSQANPGEGQYRYDLKRQTLTGYIELLPYPVFHVVKGNSHIKAGHALMLTRSGKQGLRENEKTKHIGKLVSVTGFLLQRGDLDMLQVRQIKPIKDDSLSLHTVEVEKLGRWKMTGEICDGKCLAGAMRPGRGLAHKACANLCLTGGIPPVFVSSEKIHGEEYFLIVGPNKSELPENSSSYMGEFISLEGNLERRGNLVVLQMDPKTVTKL